MRRVVCAAIAAMLVASLAGINQVASATGEVTGKASAGSFTPTLAAWTTCGDLQCSMLTVPLDYRHPDDGRTVKLAVTRLAADPAAGPYAGIMVVNPGGPGGSGTPYPVLRKYVPGSAAKRYDWIGFDPRGVGASVPALHCNPNYFGPNRPNYEPKTRGILHYWLKKSAGYAKACGSSSARTLLPYMNTRDSVQDMESLRAALQAEIPVLNAAKRAKVDKLNFYGFSYGTYLGVGYASLYPTKVGRFVLDGVVDPARFWYASNFDQSLAFDRNINVFFGWVARHNKVFHLGTKPGKIRSGFNQLLKKLDKRPSAGGKLGPDELIDAMLSAGYYVYGWADIARAYSDLVRKGRGAALYEMYASGSQGADADNGYAVYNAVQCTDQKRPPLPQQLRQTRAVHKKAPFLAWDNTWYNMPCLTWPAPAKGKITPNAKVLNALGTKILLISETKDAATPFSGALNVRQLFKGASLIAGVNGTTHAGSLSGVACVDNRIAAYLDTGVVPTRLSHKRADALCPRVPPPPADGSGRLARTAAAGMPASLRAMLEGAQAPSLR